MMHLALFRRFLLWAIALLHHYHGVTVQAQIAKTYDTALLAPNSTHRQDFCHLYHEIHEGRLTLRDALRGQNLHVVFAAGTGEQFFNYNDNEGGINVHNPGLIVSLMDNLANRAGFQWKDTFGVMEWKEVQEFSMKDVVLWSVDNYDLSANWWDQSVDRMEQGVAFLEPWFDASIILIDKEDPPETQRTSIWNWTSPFEMGVWLAIVATIFINGLAFQLIEYLNMDRQKRTLWQWFGDNLYLSSLNFTHHYEYAPSSISGRLLGVGMAFWALIIISTYTANLASLFVEESRVPDSVESIEDAIDKGIPICTFANTNADFVLHKQYPDATLVPKNSALEAYTSLREETGECGLYAGYMDNWRVHQKNPDYNPDCDLKWVGSTVEAFNAGFASKADAGYKCTSLVRDVLSLHMTELILNGDLDLLWSSFLETLGGDGQCETQDSSSSNRRLESRLFTQQDSRRRHRPLYKRQRQGRDRGERQSQRRATGDSSSSSSSSSSSDGSLSMEAMAGTFVLLYSIMALSIGIALVSRYCSTKEYLRRRRRKTRPKTYRKHGPIIGSPPPVNTHVVASSAKQPPPDEEEEDPNEEGMKRNDHDPPWLRRIDKDESANATVSGSTTTAIAAFYGSSPFWGSNQGDEDNGHDDTHGKRNEEDNDTTTTQYPPSQDDLELAQEKLTWLLSMVQQQQQQQMHKKNNPKKD